MENLPVAEILPDLLAALDDYGKVVLQAPPGAGKTTLVPEAILQHGPRGAHTLLLQPRRVAARAAANHLARRQGEQVGQQIGLQIRHERQVGPLTRLTVITEGILTRKFLSDPLLEDVQCVILDEFHERSIHSDLALAFLKELCSVREDLRVVVMSATLQAQAISRYLSDCPILTSEGRQFPLDVNYLDQPDSRALEEKVCAGVLRACRETEEGDILVFLPGVPEVQKCDRWLSNRGLPPLYTVHPFHGSLPKKAQEAVLAGGSKGNRSDGARRIILSTNIAETSITIDGVRAVVDSGYEKRMEYDVKTGLETLRLRRISRESAAQRAGRAGRLGPGVAYRIWTAQEHAQLRESASPDIQRIDLSDALLSLLHYRSGDPNTFDFFQAPPAQNVLKAQEHLALLGAIESDHARLTPAGKRWVCLPLPHRQAALLDACRDFGCGSAGVLASAILDEKEVLSPQGIKDLPTVYSDLIYRMELFDEARKSRFDRRTCDALCLQPQSVRSVQQVEKRLMGNIEALAENTIVEPDTPSEERVELALLRAFPDRICRRRKENSDRAIMVGGREVSLGASSGVRKEKFFIALKMRAGARTAGSQVRVEMASGISMQSIKKALQDKLRMEEKAIWDSDAECAIGVQQTWLHDLMLDSREGVKISEPCLDGVLHKQARDNWDSVCRMSDEAIQLRARIGLAREHLGEAWPDVSDESLKSWLDEIEFEKKSFDAVRKINWLQEMNLRIPYSEQQRLERELPTRIEVPSGSQIEVDYSQVHLAAGSAILAVRIQEVFGWTKVPQLLGGKIPLLLHLLAPNYRPAQVTSDIHSFWVNTYPEVRKELRRRYPKHAWPEDPLTASPERRPRRKR